jgi:hypothetical protein
VNSRPRVGSTTLLHSISTNILHGFTGEMSSEENAETKKANNDDQINYELPYIENSNDLHFELPLSKSFYVIIIMSCAVCYEFI